MRKTTKTEESDCSQKFNYTTLAHQLIKFKSGASMSVLYLKQITGGFPIDGFQFEQSDGKPRGEKFLQTAVQISEANEGAIVHRRGRTGGGGFTGRR